MNAMKLGGALALSLLLAACGEKQNAGAVNRVGADTNQAASQAGEVYAGAGSVTAISGDQVTIAHGPIEGIGWPAMTMTFRAGSPEMAKGVRAGDRVSFAFRQDGSAYTLTSLSKDR
ncbi:MAG: copper-binding protein [Pseudomonadota bacterium]|nr:copper-binding protein [Pseudomonadota bacterium]